MSPEVIGFAASAMSIVSFIPQVWKSWKTKSTKDVSLPMYVIYTLGQALWLTYGIFILSWPLIVTNAATTLISLSVLVLKMRYG